MGNSNWLYDYRTNVTSQHGEDGVIEQIFNKIGVRNGSVVDIGAGDGEFVSNSWYWLNETKWSGVCVEANPSFYSKLVKRYRDRNDISTFNEYVTVDNSIDNILARTDIAKDFDLLSIDIDSIDYHLWKNCTQYRPRVVVIEVNASIDVDIELVQQNIDANIGTSALSMVKLAKEKGYELVAHLVSNCVFVVEEEFDKLEIKDNSLRNLFTSPFVPKVVSDLNGVHYLIKEGPWGVSAFKIANDLEDKIKSREDGFYSVERSLIQLETDREMETNKSAMFGHTSRVNYSWDIKGVLKAFKERMSCFKYKSLDGE